MKNENVLLHPKSTLIQPKIKREAITRENKGRKERKTIKNKKTKNEKKKTRGGKKKNGKTRKGKKGRNGRTGKKARNNQARSRSNRKTVSAKCLETSHTIMKMWRDVITNFDKQSKRMEKQNGTGLSKHSKKGEFVAVVNSLLSVGGGNKSALSCAGSTTNPGAAQLKNLTDSLHECETSVDMACNSTNFDIHVNDTKLQACHGFIEEFKVGVSRCLDMTIGTLKTTTDDVCACWTNDTLAADVEAIKGCKFNTEAKAVANALNNCKATFIKCRKLQDDASKSIASCTTTSDKLKKEVGGIFIINILVASPSPLSLDCRSHCKCCKGEGSSSCGEGTGSK